MTHINDLSSSTDRLSTKRSDTEQTHSVAGTQMNALVHIVKNALNDPFHTQVIQTITHQVQTDYYQVDVDALTAHLYQALSVEGL